MSGMLSLAEDINHAGQMIFLVYKVLSQPRSLSDTFYLGRCAVRGLQALFYREEYQGNERRIDLLV